MCHHGFFGRQKYSWHIGKIFQIVSKLLNMSEYVDVYPLNM